LKGLMELRLREQVYATRGIEVKDKQDAPAAESAGAEADAPAAEAAETAAE